eukprot:TRINITY_DN6505_c0_g3_i1.p1 TRINITY_DN6505_c0_g3~~TRINITY_DN6505_c0_g3_i1.p1  ORF type:complete len:345 (+),score=31.18 TRINITY_DN6505_c0_g3_i1:68-1102(+)
MTAEASECSVCLGELLLPCRTPCGHVFCRECFCETLKSRRPWNRGACPLCRAGVSLYNSIDASSGEPLQAAPRETIFGSIYLQHGEVGVAAYHFDSPNNCYISYERAPEEWLLDDGTRPPAKKLFDNPQYDAATRTFRGTIHWPIPFGGDSRWEYEMVFADDFVVISGGGMRSFRADGSESESSAFPQDLQYVRQYELPTTIKGQAYMQGGSPATCQFGVASYHFQPGIEDAYISYEAAPQNWRMDDGSRPPMKKPFLTPTYDAATRTFTGSIDWSKVTFGGSARWDYEMVFSDDFRRIEGGSVKQFDSTGAHTRTHAFGHQLHYHLYIEEEAQLFHLMYPEFD